MHDSYKYWISKKKKKKYVAYLDLNKALSGTVSSDTVPVDKWSGPDNEVGASDPQSHMST